MWMCDAFMEVGAPMWCSASGVQNRASYPLELELGCLITVMWVFEIEVGSSARTIGPLEPSLQPQNRIF